MLHASNILIYVDLGFEGTHSAPIPLIWLSKPEGVAESKDSLMWPISRIYQYWQSLQENIYSMVNKISKILKIL
jgi:hypothetical protein